MQLRKEKKNPHYYNDRAAPHPTQDLITCMFRRKCFISSITVTSGNSRTVPRKPFSAFTIPFCFIQIRKVACRDGGNLENFQPHLKNGLLFLSTLSLCGAQ